MFLKKKAHNLFTKSLALTVKGNKTPVEKKKETVKEAVKKINVKKTVKPEQEKPVEGE